MDDKRDDLLERVARTIDMLQAIQADSRTPIQGALDVVGPIRKLTECRRAMRAKAFELSADQPDYKAAVARLQQVAETAANDLAVFELHAELVAQAAQAADAVLRVAVAVGAFTV
jgi:hypothetical protein